MDEFTERRPHRPLINAESVLFAIQLGAKCPHKLAETFDVHILNPDLIHACNDLAALRVIEGQSTRNHTTGEGFTCTPIAVVPECLRRDL
jgi:hypothetical protein